MAAGIRERRRPSSRFAIDLAQAGAQQGNANAAAVSRERQQCTRQDKRGSAAEKRLPRAPALPTLSTTEVQLTPDVQAKLDRLATETGRPKDEFVHDRVRLSSGSS